MLTPPKLAYTLLTVVVACGPVSRDGELVADASCDCGAPVLRDQARRLTVRITNTYPHDEQAFTEGLVYIEPWLYESTGLEGASSVRQVELATGRVVRSTPLAPDLFGEGLARVGTSLVQLTWRSGRALVWNTGTLVLEKELPLPGESWGACFDGQRLIVSDGTDTLRVHDSESLVLLKQVRVSADGAPVDKLNELECVDDAVYANILGSRRIVQIDLATGNVSAWVDTAGLLRQTDAGYDNADVLNGIAYVPGQNRFLLTGKRWPLVFEVELVPDSL